ncbi:MAG: rod shape-determining protein MreC [Anaerolineae bacterium]
MPRRSHRQVLVAAAFALGVTSIAAVDRVASPVHDALGRALVPAERAAHGAGRRLDAVASRGRAGEELRRQVAELQERNAELELENLKTRDLIRENGSLRDLLDFANRRVDLDLEGAGLVGRAVAEEPGNLMRTVKIDIGARQGVRRGMPVAHARGLVGRVVRVGSNWSDVMVITDPASAVVGRIERSRATGVVYGTTSGELRMRFIPHDTGTEANVEVGDIVFTSGLSREFPRMITIGQVVAVHQQDVETHQEATIRPSADIGRLEFVVVIVDFRPIDGGDEDQAP